MYFYIEKNKCQIEKNERVDVLFLFFFVAIILFNNSDIEKKKHKLYIKRTKNID